MTINNPSEYLANLWDWGILDGCFGETRIKPTDLDGFVERNCHFLVLETKAPGVEVKQGQMITFTRMVDTGFFTIFIIWGKPGVPEEMTIMTSKGVWDKVPASLEILRRQVSRWYSWANSTPAFEFHDTTT